MNGGTLSGGVVIALAATLWLAYLLPTWLRRRDYLNAERNAVRLQQTLRILAETAEAPEEVRVEATAREVARQQKILKKVRAKADAAARAHLASEERAAARLAAKANAQSDDIAAPQTSSAAQEPPRTTRTEPSAAEPTSLRTTKVSAAAQSAPRSAAAPSRAERERTFAHAVRRTRLATTGALLASLVGIGFGAYSLIAVASWGLLAASVALLVCAVAVLRRLSQQVAAHRTARESRLNVVRQDPELYDHALHVELEAPQEDLEQHDTSWAPQPLPKPMYQSPGSRAATAMASLDAAVALRRAAARAELEERAARLVAADVPSIASSIAPREPQVAQPAAAAGGPGGGEVGGQASEARPEGQQTARVSRYARMGVLDHVQAEHIDLDEALRRRRVAG
jgi:hypothetical protein